MVPEMTNTRSSKVRKMVHSSVVLATDMKGGTQLCSRPGTGTLSQQQHHARWPACYGQHKLCTCRGAVTLYSRQCEGRR